MVSRDDPHARSGGTRDPGRLLEIAFTNSEDLLAELHDLKTTFKQESDCSATEAKRILSLVNKSIQTVYEERKRLDDVAAKQDAKTGGIGLDFDALRTEIGRRLDKLRAARNSADLSDGTE